MKIKEQLENSVRTAVYLFFKKHVPCSLVIEGDCSRLYNQWTNPTVIITISEQLLEEELLKGRRFQRFIEESFRNEISVLVPGFGHN